MADEHMIPLSAPKNLKDPRTGLPLRGRPLVIYHADCDDGFGAAWVAHLYFGVSADYLPVQYGADRDRYSETIAEGINLARPVYILDFSFPLAVLERMATSAECVVLLDHHKTAKEDLQGLIGTDPKFVDGLRTGNMYVEFDMDRSGVMLAWNYFFPERPAPPMVEYIQDRDLWRKQMHKVDEFSFALRSYPQDFGYWPWRSNGAQEVVEALIEEGVHIRRSYRRMIAGLKRGAIIAHFMGYAVPVVNAPPLFASDLAGDLAEGFPFAVCWGQIGTEVVYSLRSRGDGLDVSALAKLHGGGGHKNAAGFSLKNGLPMLNVIATWDTYMKGKVSAKAP